MECTGTVSQGVKPRSLVNSTYGVRLFKGSKRGLLESAACSVRGRSVKRSNRGLLCTAPYLTPAVAYGAAALPVRDPCTDAALSGPAASSE